MKKRKEAELLGDFVGILVRLHFSTLLGGTFILWIQAINYACLCQYQDALLSLDVPQVALDHVSKAFEISNR